jgi:hypothetical protein
MLLSHCEGHLASSTKNIETIKVGEIYCSMPMPQEEYEIIVVGTMPIKVEVT